MQLPLQSYSYNLYVTCIHYIDWCCVLTSTATVIVEDPVDVEAVPNEWVQFNCTLTDCDDYHVRWYIAGRSQAIRDNNTGLVIRSFSMCTSSNQETHFLEVQATEALNNSAFYCAANQRSGTTSTCRCGADGRYFSRSALLRGKPVWNGIQFGFSFQLNFS